MRRPFLAFLIFCGAAAAPAAAGEPIRRDPFMFEPAPGEASAPSAPPPAIKPPPAPGPMLMGVLWDATRPLAIVGEESVAVGQEVAGWRIADISKDGIVIERHGQRDTLLPGQSFPPAE